MFSILSNSALQFEHVQSPRKSLQEANPPPQMLFIANLYSSRSDRLSLLYSFQMDDQLPIKISMHFQKTIIES